MKTSTTEYGPSQADIFSARGEVLEAYIQLPEATGREVLFRDFELGWDAAMKHFGVKCP